MQDKIFPTISSQEFKNDKGHFSFRQIDMSYIDEVLSLLMKYGHPKDTNPELIKERLLEMYKINIYQVVGVFNEADRLVGVASVWHMFRHYSGKSAELDHMYLEEEYRGGGLGRHFVNWIMSYLKGLQYEALELNAYVQNSGAHKLYLNMGFEILGFHHLKRL